MKNTLLILIFACSFATLGLAQPSTKAESKNNEYIVAVTINNALSSNNNYEAPARSTVASFKGGRLALDAYLSDKLNSFELGKDKTEEQRVDVEFTVQNDGSISYASLHQSVHISIDRSIIQVVESMPNWEPATHNGLAVNSKVIIPVAFKLQ